MNTRKLLGLVLLMGVLFTVPITLAKPNYKSIDMYIKLDSVTVFDGNGDGVKDSAYVEGSGYVRSACPITETVTIVYKLKYISGGESPNKWVFVSRAHTFTGTPDGTVNAFDYTFTDLPYDGWYSVSAVAILKGEVSYSNIITFDPPGGEGGPGGYD